jgi:hypothetical protein
MMVMTTRLSRHRISKIFISISTALSWFLGAGRVPPKLRAPSIVGSMALMTPTPNIRMMNVTRRTIMEKLMTRAKNKSDPVLMGGYNVGSIAKKTSRMYGLQTVRSRLAGDEYLFGEDDRLLLAELLLVGRDAKMTRCADPGFGVSDGYAGRETTVHLGLK